MIINAKTYKDKVQGCWLGKNIGGTLGAPFECVRGVWDLDFYTQELGGNPLPNDDLDLQLIWLNAAEKYGKNLNAEILGEYWLSYVCASWSEYGAGKNNLIKGIVPPISGWYHNHNRDSCGAFIRSEIWACLAPGHPEIAVKYAFEDAIVDHCSEGVYAEIFCAAVQSAAFSESKYDTLIDIGLSYIPDDCAITLAVKTAQECYKNGLDWKAARKKILQTVPGSFGMLEGYQNRTPEPDVPVGDLGFDAPSNIGLMIIGWLYGEGDFEKSMCIAAGCGEDGDCTAGTLGATMGIIMGAEKLPQKWLAPIGDSIKTISIDLTDSSVLIPQTVTELTQRTCSLMPVFMRNFCDTMNENGTVIELNEKNALFAGKEKFGVFTYTNFADRLKTLPFGITKESPLLSATVSCTDGINMNEGSELKFHIEIKNNLRKQQWLNFRWIVPEDWCLSAGKEFTVNLDSPHGGYGFASFDITLHTTTVTKPEYTAVLEISSIGRLGKMYIPITLLNNPQTLFIR